MPSTIPLSFFLLPPTCGLGFISFVAVVSQNRRPVLLSTLSANVCCFSSCILVALTITVIDKMMETGTCISTFILPWTELPHPLPRRTPNLNFFVSRSRWWARCPQLNQSTAISSLYDIGTKRQRTDEPEHEYGRRGWRIRHDMDVQSGARPGHGESCGHDCQRNDASFADAAKPITRLWSP